jgi:hypothetical protein
VRLGPGASDPLDPLDDATEDPAKCKEFNAKAKEEVCAPPGVGCEKCYKGVDSDICHW